MAASEAATSEAAAAAARAALAPRLPLLLRILAKEAPKALTFQLLFFAGFIHLLRQKQTTWLNRVLERILLPSWKGIIFDFDTACFWGPTAPFTMFEHQNTSLIAFELHKICRWIDFETLKLLWKVGSGMEFVDYWYAIRHSCDPVFLYCCLKIIAFQWARRC